MFCGGLGARRDTGAQLRKLDTDLLREARAVGAECARRLCGSSHRTAEGSNRLNRLRGMNYVLAKMLFHDCS